MRQTPTKIIVNPSYGHLEEFVKQIPGRFSSEGRVIHKARNEIRVFKVDDLELNVKRYKIPLFINRFIYSFCRKPKAVRAYEYALRLISKGIKTPKPIGYILFKRKALLGYSYFISVQSSFQTLYEIGKAPAEENEDVYRALGLYMAELHEKGIYHADFSPGNVLYKRTDEGVDFCLIDINRMHFGNVAMKKGCKNFARLWGRTSAFLMMAETYAESRHFNKEKCIHWILQYRNLFWKKYALRHKIEFEM